MESKLRKPLATTSNLRAPSASKLMAPGTMTKLPKPGSKLMPPKGSLLKPSISIAQAKATHVPSIKRKASPVEAPPNKRAKPSVPAPRATGMARRAAGPGSSSGIKPAANKNQTMSSRTTASKKPVSKPAGGKARPAWDLKGRLEDMESALKVNMNQQSSNNDRIRQLEALNTNLQTEVTTTSVQSSQTISELEKKLRQTEQDLEDHTRRSKTRIEELDDSNHQLTRKNTTLEETKHSLERQVAMLESDLGASRQEASVLKSTVSSMTAAQSGLQAELTHTKMLLDHSVKRGKEQDELISQLQNTVAAMQTQILSMQKEKKYLHNQVQELKGNIRVFARVRPLLGDEVIGHPTNIPDHISFLSSNSMELEKINDASPNETMSGLVKKGAKYDFKFDKVFTPHASQQEVFDEISQLVQSALDGYNVCIFAYGQTGSGKTHTMEGPDEAVPEQLGMIPRAVAQIFETESELEQHGWTFKFEASYLEIYNESIRDLLGNGKEGKHEIRMTAKNSTDVLVTDIQTVEVKSENQVHKLLKKATENRAVAATKCNERSSRSHSVFRLKLIGTNAKTGEETIGNLNLVDLAGSERLKESGSAGTRLKETQAINKSLSSLGNVIMALAKKESHIPYRNSKLTHLLMNSLGGNSKTLMFVNVSPVEEYFGETLNSLRFATKVNNCNIGTATQKKS